MTGPLESTNELYAIAKIAGIKWCESYNRQYRVDYRSVMPTNRDGIGDNYRLQKSHVIPVLIRRLHEAIINGASVVSLRGMWNMNLDKASYRAHTSPMQSWLRRRYYH